MMRLRTISLAATTMLAGLALAGSDVETSFEFDDLSTEFTLGTNFSTVTFIGGEAKTVGIQGLYRTGMNAWMINPDSAGTIFFETPAESVTLFLRDQFSKNASILAAFAPDGQLVAQATGSPAGFVEVTLKNLGPISHIHVRNNGQSGLVAIDDFSFAAGAVRRTSVSDPFPKPIVHGDHRLKLRPIADGLTAPNWGTPIPGDPFSRLMVTDQAGTLWEMDLDSGQLRVFLDVSSKLVVLGIGGPGTFDERGLLGVAFHPDYMTNGLLYTYESHPADGPPDFTTLQAGEPADHQTVITEYVVSNPGDRVAVPDLASGRELLVIDQPQFNHDGGAVSFGHDGLLYVSLGDGGRRDDQTTGHVAGGNGIDETNILGNVLRIDPLGNNSANGQYGIPPTNPFVSTPGLDEIYAYGFRNPFRFSFDQKTGALWLADVGQGHVEEVNIVEPGLNYGWRIKEGTFLFDPDGEDPGFAFLNSPGVPEAFADPIAQYDHDEGIAVIGGFVHRGAGSPLAGRYVFGEFAVTFSSDGRLFYLDGNDDIQEFSTFGRAGLERSLLGFGQDVNGEMYAMVNGTGVPFESTGEVLKLVPISRAPLDSISVINGTLESGTLADVLEDDESALVARSGVSTSPAIHMTDLEVIATSPALSPSLIDVALQLRIDEPAAVVSLSLRNWNTNRFEKVGAVAAGFVETTRLIEDIPAGNFVRSGDGRIEMRIKLSVTGPFLRPRFDTTLDLVEIGVR